MGVDDDGIRVHTCHGVRWVVIDRPERRNALTPAHRDRVVEEVELASADRAVRCLALTGTGPVFCAGGDLAPGGGPAGPAGPDEVVRLVRNAQRLVTAVVDATVPVVVAMNGDAVGLGAALALAGDLVVAPRGARFRFPFLRRGIVPDSGLPYLLPRLVGPALARQLLLLGEDLSVERAHDLGIVARVTDPPAVLVTATDLAKDLASGPTVALGLTRRLLSASPGQDRATALEEEARAQAAAVVTEDAREGLVAFAERRPPRFRGR